MNQIAIGSAFSGWLILSGQSVAAPFKRALISPVLSSAPLVSDQLSLSLEGTPDQISSSLASLERVQQRSSDSPQYLRFQPVLGGIYFYAPLSDLHFEFNSQAYTTHHTGSLLLTLHFTRPNYFDSDKIALPLSNRNGTRITTGITIYNHTDEHAGHDSSVLIAPADIVSDLPAPLRFELQNTTATGVTKDIYVGLYHHPSNDYDEPFFLQSTDFLGGELLYSSTAINEYYLRLSFSSGVWSPLGFWTLDNEHVNLLAGRTYRPFLRFYNAHAYSDLYLKLKLQRGDTILFEGEPVFSDPSYQYLLFPPVRIPPFPLLGEELPHHIDLYLYAQHEVSGTYQIDVDQLFLLSLDSSASFLGFFNMEDEDILIDDSFRGLHNVHYSVIGSETVAHLRQGGPFLLTPGEYNRLFFYQSNGANMIWILRTSKLKAFYRKRVRLL